MRSVPPWLLAVVAVVALFLVAIVVRGCFGEQDTPAGVRADTVLMEDPRWRDSVKIQDAVIAQLHDSVARADRARRRWQDSARVLLRSADDAQAAVDSTVAAGVPDSVEPARFWKDQYEAQRRVAATLRSQTVPALLATIAADSTAIRFRDATIDTLTRQRDAARARVAVVTSALADLREATKPGVKVLGLRLPGWVDNAVEVGAGVALGYVAAN